VPAAELSARKAREAEKTWVTPVKSIEATLPVQPDPESPQHWPTPVSRSSARKALDVEE
jgi:hypothetical protein